MAIRTLGKRDLFLKIATLMAQRAVHRGVLPEERIFGLRMVEVPVHPSQGNLFPACCAVAGFAALREAAMVKVNVAIRAFAKREPGIARLAVRVRRMAFFALHLRVLPGERIARLAVIEFANGHRFPVGVVMALQTVGS